MGVFAGGGREAGGGSSSNGAKERVDVGGGDGHSGDRLDFSPGDRRRVRQVLVSLFFIY